MNSLIGRSRILAAVLGVVLLAACNAITTEDTPPTIATPTANVVLQGTITGLGTRRPVVLQYKGTDSCYNNAADQTVPSGTLDTPTFPCKFFGTLNQTDSTFSFGALPSGTAYNIQVTGQPFDRICTVTNGTGTLNAAAPLKVTDIVVKCVVDPAVPRYAISGSVASTIPTPVDVTLTTEEGTQTRTGIPPGGTFSFDGAIFNSGTANLPPFGYRVTAKTTVTTAGNTTVNNCTMSASSTNQDASGNASTPPTGDVSNVTVNACTFKVTVDVAYRSGVTGVLNLGSPVPALRTDNGGLQVALKDPVTGLLYPKNLDSAQTPQILTFTSYSTQSFTGVPSNSAAIYDLVIVQQPTGQTCVVGSAANTSPTFKLVSAAAVLMVDPTDVLNGFLPADATVPTAVLKSIRCQNTPVDTLSTGTPLRGTYQLTTLTNVTVTSATGTTVTPTNVLWHSYLTFFDDGTFLYGAHGSSCSTSSAFSLAGCGVEHGFYVYCPANTGSTNLCSGTASPSIVLTPVTDTLYGTNSGSFVVGTTTSSATNTTTSPRISTAGGNLTLTNAAKTPGSPNQITAQFSSTSSTSNGTTTATVVTWQLDEVTPIASQMTGAWATDDHRRVWVYDADTYSGFHMGVNGMGSAEAGCFPIGDPTALTGFFTRRIAVGCPFLVTSHANRIAPANATVTFSNPAVIELPSTLTTPRVPAGYVGRWPQSLNGGSATLPTSPIDYTIEPGASADLDTLTIQDTANGTPVNPPIVFHRVTVN